LITIDAIVTIRPDSLGTGENPYPFWSVKEEIETKTFQGSKARKEPEQAAWRHVIGPTTPRRAP
jgi:hypothetical protein